MIPADFKYSPILNIIMKRPLSNQSEPAQKRVKMTNYIICATPSCGVPRPNNFEEEIYDHSSATTYKCDYCIEEEDKVIVNEEVVDIEEVDFKYESIDNLSYACSTRCEICAKDKNTPQRKERFDKTMPKVLNPSSKTKEDLANGLIHFREEMRVHIKTHNMTIEEYIVKELDRTDLEYFADLTTQHKCHFCQTKVPLIPDKLRNHLKKCKKTPKNVLYNKKGKRRDYALRDYKLVHITSNGYKTEKRTKDPKCASCRNVLHLS